jgi:hypothetical protein
LIKDFRESRLGEAKRKLGGCLRQITERIANTKPITAIGALAVIDYVQVRLSRDDLVNLFADDGDKPGKFSRVLRAAHPVLRRATVSRRKVR